MVNTIKFSEFADGGDLANDETTVGLNSGVNTRFNNPWTFLPPGSTGDRPIPAAAMYYRLRFNTTLEIYEYYDPTIPIWVELSGSGTGTVNPGVANDIAFYAASGQAVSPIAGAANAVLVSNSSEIPSMSTTLPTGLSIPGAIITASTAALLSGSVAAAPVSGTDLTNKTYVDSLVAGAVTSATGTVNQVLINGTVGIPQTGALTFTTPQDIATGSTPTFGGLTLTSIPLNPASGGTGVNNGTSTLTLAGSLATIGAFSSNFTMTGATNVTFPTSGTLATTSQLPTPAALTKTDDTNVTLLLGGSPTIALLAATSLTLGWTGLLAKNRGGTSVSAATTAPTAGEFAGWDANRNLSADNMLNGFTTTATAAATTTLTVDSTYIQEFTGVTTQTVALPVTSTLAVGQGFYIINNSSGNVTINSSGGNAVLVMAANTTAFVTCVLTSGTTAASWNASYVFDAGAGVLSLTGTANQIIFSASTGNITASLPQDIATSSTPKFNNSIGGFTAITSAAGTTTLTTTSNYIQQITGSTTQTIQMPVTSTLQQGQSWQIINNSTGVVTVNSSGSNLIISLAANTSAIVTCILTSGTTAASWTTSFSTSGGGSGIVDAWVQYTPTFTGFGTPTSVNIWSRRVGGNLEVRGSFATGTVTATEARITLGYQGTNSNVTISSTVMNSQVQIIGTVAQGVSGASSVYNLGLQTNGYFTFSVQNATRNALTSAVASDVFNNAQAITFMLSVPITGWS